MLCRRVESNFPDLSVLRWSYMGSGVVSTSTQWPLDLGMVRSTVRNAQGLQLSCYTFPAKKPVATIIFHHGYSVYGRFEFLRASKQGGLHDSYDDSFIQVMRDAGLTVVVMDMQGMGDSERVRPSVPGYFERFEHLAEDLLTVTDAVTSSTSLPLTLTRTALGLGSSSASVTLTLTRLISRPAWF